MLTISLSMKTVAILFGGRCSKVSGKGESRKLAENQGFDSLFIDLLSESRKKRIRFEI